MPDAVTFFKVVIMLGSMDVPTALVESVEVLGGIPGIIRK